LAQDINTWSGNYYTGSVWNVGTYTFNFSIYDDKSAGSICYSNTTSITTDSIGYWTTEQYNISNNCNVNSEDYYLNINIDGQDQNPRRLLKTLKLSDMVNKEIETRMEIQKKESLEIVEAITEYYKEEINE